ncbi:MAG: proline--tRNA ligase [bacterium]
MRYSKYFLNTLKEDPSDAEVISHKLMLRAGMIKKLAAGIYNYLPLGLRAIRRVEDIIREEHDKEGCIELLMPAVQPAELWEESGRWPVYGPELLRIKDRKDADFCFGPTHEEIITDIVRREIKSYRQLPVTLYQIQTKFRDEIRPRFGLMRGREFIMKDAYSFDPDEKACDQSYWRMYEVYKRIFNRCGLKFRPVEADSGAIGGSFTHEFHVLAQSGEDTILSCSECDYTANIEQAERLKDYENQEEKKEEIKEICTPNVTTIEQLSGFLRVPKEKIEKSLLLNVGGKYVLACLRGDREANIPKIRRALGVDSVELASEEEILNVTKAPQGFTGPYGISGVEIIADIEIKGMKNFVSGANKKDTHLINVNWDKIKVSKWADLSFAEQGQTCPRCKKGKYQKYQGIEVGQVFKLGTKYSHKMKAAYLDAKGREHEIVMGCYGIGVGRTVAAAIEQNHDDRGIIWPWSIAPFHISLLNLDPDNSETDSVSDNIYKELVQNGYDVLYDERNERPGFKFADADLLGFPIRLTVGSKSLKRGGVEITNRKLGREGNELVPPDKILEAVVKFKKRHEEL